jgi:hypothetical protein
MHSDYATAISVSRRSSSSGAKWKISLGSVGRMRAGDSGRGYSTSSTAARRRRADESGLPEELQQSRPSGTEPKRELVEGFD